MNGPGTRKFEKELRRISRNLRLRFDRVRYRYVIEQRDCSGRWSMHQVLEGPSKSFRKPSKSDLRWLRISDCRRFLLGGKQNWRAWDRFMGEEFEKGKGDEELRQTKKFAESNEAMRDMLSWYYKKYWQRLPNYSRKDITNARRIAERRLERMA